MADTTGGPAFPVHGAVLMETGLELVDSRGMALRDWFAGMALVSLGDHKAVEQCGIPWLAEHAYMMADAMLAEREKSDG